MSKEVKLRKTTARTDISWAYKSKVKESMKRHIFTVDWEGFEKKFEAEMAFIENDSNPTHSSYNIA